MKIFGIAMALAFASMGQTVEPEMTADRPGFRNSTHLVGPGVVQLENGFDFTSDHSLSMEPEIRVGALPWLELRLRADSVVLRPSLETGLTGTSDLQPAIKFPIINEFHQTRVVAILKSTVPSGHSSQTSGGYEPGAEIIWEHKWTEAFSLAGTFNMTRLKQERFVWQPAGSVAANTSFGKRLRAFSEVYVVSPKKLGAGNQWAVDAGLMKVLSDYLMVDVAAAHSVHGPSDWFVAVGFSVRTRVPGLPRFGMRHR